ncbi:hypothetical protein M513_02537 [Trichuris suis]|uniref:Sodium:neurotransmitter symporter family protein n=1 Tax=Trichuris suis TaxID=68888 RepID=A0A085MGT7_9BILA|nr:hypothetical protein M513_02537 [Trichuris suis]
MATRTTGNFIIEEWRDLWSFKSDFIIVCFVYVFSSTSILALPKMFIENGGGAFGVAYLISLLVCCTPLVMMELAVGQLCASSPPKSMFNMSPLFAGVGTSYTLLSLLTSSIYVAYASYIVSLLVHLFMSIENETPSWAPCPEKVAIDTLLEADYINVSASENLVDINKFFQTIVLNATSGVEETGKLQWLLISGSAFVWLVIFIALFLGVRWLGKVCYFTFVIPLLLVLTLLVKSLSTEGANVMVQKIFETDWQALYKMETWMCALSQSLYGTGLCFGAYITLGSFNRRNNNLVGDTFLIVLIHAVLSCLGLVTVAALLGHLAIKCNQPYEKALTYDFSQLLNLLEAVGHFEHPHLWSALLLLFFLLLIFNFLYVLVLNIQTPVEDAIGDSASHFFPRTAICLAVCTLGFVITLGYNTQSGFPVIRIIVKYLDLFCPWFLLALEIFAIAWVYCAHLLARDVSQMITSRLFKIIAYPFFELTYLLPAVPIFIAVVKLQMYNNSLTDQRNIWVELIGWAMVLILLPVPINIVYCIAKTCFKGPGFSLWEVAAGPIGDNYSFNHTVLLLKKFKYAFASPLRYEVPKVSTTPRYTSTAPGYVLLPHAPLAEPEQYTDVYNDRQQMRVSKA